ncbi:DUF1289 domain-containing protein [Shewanella sp. OMA3-2]|uniref:DUF1289 domain-containing protein n=1 Tax=Shewanella sp. OMA3-2 TaxID=2908650 RepID=UPI001F1D491A|nr:DUF1289 domain-containing protein [Shewanella sp. OMA3-2]UJF23002.1 DUF1289 domain-containing protein [Shewanella sp. OMA3-2]
MEQLSFFAIPSPCVGVCQSDTKGYCTGCFRSRDERFNWMSFSELQKQDIVRLCVARRKRRQYALFKSQKLLQQQQQANSNNQFDFDQVDEMDLLGDLSQFELD